VEGEPSTIAVAIDGADIVLEIEKPKLVLIMGCVGFGLNLISVLFLHGMDYAPSLELRRLWTQADSLVDHSHDHGDGHSHSHSHGHEHSHSHGTDSGEASSPETSPDRDPDAVGLVDGKVSTILPAQ
jgi:ABC-type nickel/cobalt efflux system permease component RcnA